MQLIALDADPTQLEIVCTAMQSLGHDCEGFTNATPFMFRLRHCTFDLVLMDDAFAAASFPATPLWIRESVSSALPVILISARTAESDLVAALDGGADDLVLKPVRVRELQARVQAILWRRYPERVANSPIGFGPYRFVAGSQTVLVNGEAIVLRELEYKLALFLLRNMGRQLSRDYLLTSVWPEGSLRSHRTVDTHVSRVRTRLRLVPANGFLLTSIYGIGYRLDAVPEGPLRSGDLGRNVSA